MQRAGEIRERLPERFLSACGTSKSRERRADRPKCGAYSAVPDTAEAKMPREARGATRSGNLPLLAAQGMGHAAEEAAKVSDDLKGDFIQ